MTHPSPPPKLPTFIFLLSDHTTIELAVDVAKALEGLDSELVSWNFIEPVHDAIGAFIDGTWGVELIDPRTNPHGDHIKDLATWVDNHFGPDYLGARAFLEAKTGRDMGDDHTIVFRDATWTHIAPFLKEFKSHEYLIVQLSPIVPSTMQVVKGNYDPDRHLLPSTNVEAVVAAILEASK